MSGPRQTGKTTLRCDEVIPRLEKDGLPTIAKALDAPSAAHFIARLPTGRGFGVSDPA